MSFSCSGLQRSDRLLPLESCDVLAATDRFRLHVLDGEHDAKLHERVSFYWDQQRSYQSYQRRLLREVRSTRGPVRFVGFPQVRQVRTPKKTEKAAAGGAMTNSTAEQRRSCGASDTAALSAPVPSDQHEQDCGDDIAGEDSKWAPPRSLAAWSWVRLVAPYERLLCPSLLFSALLSPAVGSSTSLVYGTQPPSSSLPLASGCVSAHWSVQTCRTLWRLHEVAAAASLPAQEVYVLCSGTLLYLDVVLSSGKVWAELEKLWGRDLTTMTSASGGGDAGVNSDSKKDTNADHDARQAEVNTLATLQANLSQPPQTYASLLQHLRILVEALLYAAPIGGGGSAQSVHTPTESPPQPLLPWLQSAAEAEEWTALANTSANSSAAPPSPSSPSSSSVAGRASQRSSAVAQVLKLAVQEWLSRRGATVAATAPTGSRAVALPMRDLCVSRGLQPASQLRSSHCPATGTPTTRSRQVNAIAGGEGAAASATVTRGARAPPGRGGRTDPAVQSSFMVASTNVGNELCTTMESSSTYPALSFPSAGISAAFEPFEPHDTPRAHHPFLLPPLPQDPALLVFTTVWRRTLRRCVLERDVLRQQLRQVILGQAGQRCEELLRAVRQQQAQWEAEGNQPNTTPQGLSEKAAGEESSAGQDDRHAANLPTQATSTNTSPDSTATSSTSSPSAAPQWTGPTPLLLLTSDPAATAFRVLGPRSGEWLTSRVGMWSGFRGELFRCVGPPHPPLPLSFFATASLSSSSTVGRHGPSSARLRQHLSSTLKPHGEATSTLSEMLLEPFVDGALELDSGTHASSPSPSSFGSAMGVVVPVTTEELADRLCRLGASLPRYATEVSGDRLRTVDADFAREVLQQQCLPLFLACKRRGIQQWSLRGWLKGVVLTMLDNSGTESRVATPAKLLEMGRQQLAAAMGGTDTTDTATALRMVMEGGLSETVAFLEHVQKRKDRMLRWMPVKKAAAAAESPVAVSLVTLSAVEALLLRRAEESAIFSIFQCHPQAVALGGCGVRRLALHASAHKGRPSLLLVRTCGVVVEWDVQDCYEPPRYRRLRVPKRLTTERKRRGQSVSGVAATDDALPPEIGNAVERLTLRHVRGMLQYYCRALLSSSSASAKTAAAQPPHATHSPSPPSPAEASLCSCAPSQAAGVGETTPSATHVAGTKRLREDEEGHEAHLAEGDSNAVPAAPVAAAVNTAAEVTEASQKEGAETTMFTVKQEPPAEKGGAEGPDTHVSGAASPPDSPSSSQLSHTAEVPRLASTNLFPVDRAVALFVLRHHPQYYTSVVGCGIKEVLVAVASTCAADNSSARSAAGVDVATTVDAETGMSATHTGPAEGHHGVALKSSSFERVRGNEAALLRATPTSLAAAESHTSTSPSNASLKPVLVVERVCGQRVEVDIEVCYDQGVDGCPLRPRVILE
jgi:hypothetical protein